MEQEHKRRVRYKGTHPRNYREKYKELNPEKYQDDVEKIIQSGKTPAGMHIPIMVEEILSFLDIQPGQVGLDATLGYGGWNDSRARGTCTPQTWTPSSRKRPEPVLKRWASGRRF